MKATAVNSWAADELVANVDGKKYWLFNVMDSKTRFALTAYLSPVKTARASATASSMARERAKNHPEEIKTDELRSYCETRRGHSLPAGSNTSSVKASGRKSTTT